MWVDPWDPNIGAVDDQLDHRSTYAAARHPGDGLLRSQGTNHMDWCDFDVFFLRLYKFTLW